MRLDLDDFPLLSRLTGTWQGDFICLDADGGPKRRYSCIINQRIANGRWVQTNDNRYDDGSADRWRFFGHAIGAGVMQLESPDPPFCDFCMTASEAAPHVLLLVVRLERTGAVLATEAFTLIDPSRRTRAIQQFDAETGDPQGFMLVKERKMVAPTAHSD